MQSYFKSYHININMKLLNADIVIFATPIWWGGQSSLVQRMVERLDEIHDEIMDSGKSRLIILDTVIARIACAKSA
jgi:hypothetical protein